MTNLMEHGACTLDISSDEERETRRREEDLRGKENVPPVDDVSQTSGRLPSASHDHMAEAKANARKTSSRRRKEIEEGAIEIDRSPLGDLEAEEFYAEGCTSSDVVLVADEEGDSDEPQPESYDAEAQALPDDTHLQSYDSIPEEGLPCEAMSSPTFDFAVEVDALMTKSEMEAPAGAKLFEPLEKAEEGFEVWESASAKGEGEEEEGAVL
jgi:hypothetical protein